MAIYTHEQNGIVSIGSLAYNIMSDLKNNGFTLKYPTNLDQTTKKAIFETTPNVNQVNDNDVAKGIKAQPWRICIEADVPATSGDATEALQSGLRIYAGTVHQLPDTGDITAEFVDKDGKIRKSGELSVGRYGTSSTKFPDLTIPFFSYDGADTAAPFYSENISNLKAHPMSYRIVISPNGVALVVWLEASDLMGDKFSWFAIQHLVDPITGDPNRLSKCPVFCLFSTGGGNVKNEPWKEELAQPASITMDYPKIYRFVVREADVLRPTFPQNACVPSADNAAVINPYQQVSIYENKTFALTMPSNFHTDRYLYKEEMDLIMYTSADVISQWNTASLSMFTPSRLREYTAMHANLPNNAGLRVLILSREVESAVG